MDWALRERTSLSFAIGREFENSSVGSQSNAVDTTFEVGIKQSLGDKISIGLTGEFEISEFPRSNGIRRKDRKYTFEIDVTYQVIRWLSIGFDYKFENNLSNVDASEFRKNELSLTVGLGVSF